MRFNIISKILFIILIGGSGVQTFAQDTINNSKDSLSAAAKTDSIAAAYKMEALKQALGGDYRPIAPVADNYQPPDLSKVAIRMSIGLIVILILLYVLYVLSKKIRNVESPTANDNQSAIQLLDSKFLGAGKNIFLIKAGAERVLVVGAASENMRTLSEIQGEEARYILEMYHSKPVNSAQFSATVDHLLRRFKREGGN
ncbi:MAG: flagellar biosynthetic protein FliO [Fibromonadaceae bacterium]|jgi:flagellar biogenesis protein FliO|nr:flagellar biosynthetic protein FliO [Fibromonadaceae bacterium]